MISDPNEEVLRSALARRYEIEGLLGRGGMGVVYLARDLRLERPVALKVPSADRAADPAFRQRFLREARTAAALLHPNIVPIYAVHEVGEMIFFAMAYVAGETLDQRLEREGALSPETAARLLRELADALAYAHARGVVHRDVKPDNILLDAASGRALLSDFGIARMSGDGRSTLPPSDGGVAGAAAFMSPEQARGEPVDSRSDLYSLGIVGYYALTGRLPFTGETDVLVLALHATTPPPPLVVPGVPRRLAQAVERCLAKHAGDRFPDGAALGRALSQALPQHAVPPIAVRAFLTRSAHLAGPALMYEAFVGLIAAPATLWCWLYTDAGALCGAAAAALAGLVLVPLVVAWARARRLLADGHGWEDLIDALVVERERHCEELRFVYGEAGSPFERGLEWLAWIATVVTTATTVALFSYPDLTASTEIAVVWAAAAGTALIAASVAQARTEQRTDPRGARRVRFWSGWLGRLLFRLAAARWRRAPTRENALRSLETPA